MTDGVLGMTAATRILYAHPVAQGCALVRPLGKEAAGGVCYQRHRPEETLLYELIEQHYPVLVDHLAEQGKSLPDYVQDEFEAYLKCGRQFCLSERNARKCRN